MLGTFFCALMLPVAGQILDNDNKVSVGLSDGIHVTLYGAAKPMSDEKSLDYYYLPTNLKLAKKVDGTPQFLFLKYTSEERSDTKGISGGILHLLMEYGLDKEQEKELQRLLERKQKGAKLKGMAQVKPDGDNSVQVISATLSNSNMTRKLVFSGKAPSLPGNKIALAADLDKNGAQLLAATFEKAGSISDLSITLAFQYSTLFPAARGYILEDYSKLDSLNLIDSASYTHTSTSEKDYGEKSINGIVGGLIGGPIGAAIGWFGSGNKEENHFTYDETHQLYSFLEENEVIQMHFEENLNDERVAKIRDTYFQYFLNSFTERSAAAPPARPGKKEVADIPDIKHGNSYKFNRHFVESILEKRKRVFNLNYKTAVTHSFQLTENLSSWYNGVKDNPTCVGVINLNDPFFTHRDIQLVLDLDAEEMFGKELNYVTVSLRKKRESAGTNDYYHQLTFDKRFFEEKGNRATITYSRAEDENPEAFEYQVQWSLRGGNLYPLQDTSWVKGSWQGITLYPPVRPEEIHFEADLEELKNLDIRNATLQLRYKKFDREVETNFNISLSAEQPGVKKTIFLDKDTEGYVYRLVFTHKHKGVLAMPWQPRINTNYLFAVVPEELRQKDESFIEKAIEAGKTIVSASRDGEVKEEARVLDRFKDIVMNE